MIIELFGLPGSGKTTLAHMMHQQYGWNLVPPLSRAVLLWYSLLFFLSYPLFCIITVWYIVQQKKWIYLKIMNVFLQHNAAYMYAAREPKSIWVFPEGHRQQMIALFEQVISKEKIDGYLKRMPPITCIVLLDIDHSSLETRILQRGYFAREFASKAYIQSWKNHIYRMFQTYSQLIEQQQIPCIRMKEHTSIQILYKQLFQYVRN